MSRVLVAGAGAFGTALAIVLASTGSPTTLWARRATVAKTLQAERCNQRYLPDAPFPEALGITDNPLALMAAEIVLLAIPTQNLRTFLDMHKLALGKKVCVICCKGLETDTGLLPGGIVDSVLPDARIAVLTGPGFADEIARGLPTALTLAMAGPDTHHLQARLSTQTVRLYRSHDPVGAQLGGALKNVIAIACGIAIGAGLGESARAALMTRGYAEIRRLAIDIGAQEGTLSGLSGLGDLALTCGSEKSRNFSLGLDLGRGRDRGRGVRLGPTVEGVATAEACLTLARPRGIEMPIATIVTAVLKHELTIPQAVEELLSRPLKSET